MSAGDCVGPLHPPNRARSLSRPRRAPFVGEGWPRLVQGKVHLPSVPGGANDRTGMATTGRCWLRARLGGWSGSTEHRGHVQLVPNRAVASRASPLGAGVSTGRGLVDVATSTRRGERGLFDVATSARRGFAAREELHRMDRESCPSKTTTGQLEKSLPGRRGQRDRGLLALRNRQVGGCYAERGHGRERLPPDGPSAPFFGEGWPRLVQAKVRLPSVPGGANARTGMATTGRCWLRARLGGWSGSTQHRGHVQLLRGER